MKNCWHLQLTNMNLLSRVDDSRLHLLNQGRLRNDGFCIRPEGIPLANLIDLHIIRRHWLGVLPGVLGSTAIMNRTITEEHLRIIVL